MAISRSPLAYLQRVGIEPKTFPRPRFDPSALRVHQYDVGNTEIKFSRSDGDPPPDRAAFYPWPPSTTE